MNCLLDNFNYIITQNFRLGAQKHSIKKTDTEKTNVYSIEDARGLRDTAKNFCKWMEQNHPEIKKLKNVDKVHVQEWINYRSKNWTNKTMQCHLSHLEKMERQARKTFKSCHRDFANVDMPFRVNEEKKRNISMSEEDLQKMRESFAERNTQCSLALEIEYRLGLRILELSRIRYEYISIDNRIVILPNDNNSGTKGKRGRSIHISDRDIDFFRNIVSSGKSGRIFSISEDSINRGFRRCLKDLGLDKNYDTTTCHAIRKYWGKQYYEELLSRGFQDNIKTFDLVSKELGHNDNRYDLYRTYIIR